MSIHASVIDLKEPSDKDVIEKPNDLQGRYIQQFGNGKAIISDARILANTQPQTAEYTLLIFSFMGFIAFGHSQKEKKRRGL